MTDTAVCFEDHVGLLVMVVNKFKRRVPAYVQFDDMIQEGAFGLMWAIERFRPELGFRFSTFADPCIRRRIQSYLRASTWLPEHTWKQRKALDRIRYDLENELLRHANEAEMAEAAGLPLQDYQALWDRLHGHAIDPMPMHEDGEPVEMQDDPYDRIWTQQLLDIVWVAVEALPERERTLIDLYYRDEQTFAEIGLILGLSASRVAQVHDRTILKLRAKLRRFRE